MDVECVTNVLKFACRMAAMAINNKNAMLMRWGLLNGYTLKQINSELIVAPALIGEGVHEIWELFIGRKPVCF
jgi:hypothetical protein